MSKKNDNYKKTPKPIPAISQHYNNNFKCLQIETLLPKTTSTNNNSNYWHTPFKSTLRTTKKH